MAGESQIVRTIKLDSAVDAAVEMLRRVDGVDVVEKTAPQKLRITYDFSRTGWGELCEQLKAVGAYTRGGLLTRWRDDWRDFQEQNMRDNLAHKPACCSKPPAGAGRK